MSVIAGRNSPDVLEYLLKRRSVKVDDLVEPGPRADELEQILTAASRVPDHGKVVPFYYLVFSGEARAQAGEVIAQAFLRDNPEASEDQVAREKARFSRAPLVVAIIHRARKAKHPQWEQILTCGAVAQNFLLAANALGYGAQWLTEWYAYDDDVRGAFGLDETDHVAGFMMVGSVGSAPEERDRPDLPAIVTHWSPEAEVQKGEQYHREKFPYPRLGITRES